MIRSSYRIALWTAALTILVAIPAAAVEPFEISLKQAGPTTLMWSANQDFGSVTLQMTGPDGFQVKRTFNGSAEVSFDLENGGGDLQDGVYRWTLTYASAVDAELDRAMAEARKAGQTSLMEDLRAAGLFASGVSSGTFLMSEGQMIIPAQELEPTLADTDLPTKDQVIADDLIVDGSACVGFDCVNGEAFGFDTLRLKENNLRIKFDDTSLNNFPANDWQLTINDSANGGLSKFSIDDITNSRTPFTVEARAPSHSLYVDDGGRVGVGTSTPVAEVHVKDGETPTLRLEQDGSAGFAPITWDVAGNEANFFIRDVTNGSTLPFRIRPSAPTDSLHIIADGNVGMGTSSPDHQLHVVESGSVGDLRIAGEFENNGPVSLQLTNGSNGENWVFSNKPTGFEVSKGGTGQIEMRLDGGGNLFLTGAITTAGGNYPDYVFDEGYDLMPLDDLAAFIQQNGHLPNIKSEEEVEFGKRINMTELQIGLLEKVEELTLYTLDQHETIRDLRGTVDAQHELIQKLEARLSAVENDR